MVVCVYGLWHLGVVTAACLAEHFQVVGCDPDPSTILGLRAGHPQISEPGLEELVISCSAAGTLSFSFSLDEAVRSANVVWVTFDTPVDSDDVPDHDVIWNHIALLFPLLSDGGIVVISSQVPVGFTGRVVAAYRSQYPDRNVTFAYSPENLRLGQALEAFRRPARIVVGVQSKTDQVILQPLFAPFCKNIEWMSVESAEMTKHAVNSFLATSIAYVNELAMLCEMTGADAKEVARGLKTEPRIGPQSYLNPGVAFAGGTLARDVVTLTNIGRTTAVPTPLLSAVIYSNDQHKTWPRRKIEELLNNLPGKTVAVLGLAYKPGTNTLRRSSAVELCVWLANRGARVQAFDPAIRALPADLQQRIWLCSSVPEALLGAHALVIASECPVFRSFSADDAFKHMAEHVVIDVSGFLAATLRDDRRFRYVCVGYSPAYHRDSFVLQHESTEAS
jgi:UDPglucose 6-dehydrogenase